MRFQDIVVTYLQADCLCAPYRRRFTSGTGSATPTRQGLPWLQVPDLALPKTVWRGLELIPPIRRKSSFYLAAREKKVYHLLVKLQSRVKVSARLGDQITSHKLWEDHVHS